MAGLSCTELGAPALRSTKEVVLLVPTVRLYSGLSGNRRIQPSAAGQHATCEFRFSCAGPFPLARTFRLVLQRQHKHPRARRSCLAEKDDKTNWAHATLSNTPPDKSQEPGGADSSLPCPPSAPQTQHRDVEPTGAVSNRSLASTCFPSAFV